MILDPETREAVIERTAAILAAQAVEAMGGIGGLILIDLGTAAQCLGVTKPQVRGMVPVVRLTARTSGVKLADLQKVLNPL